MPSVIDPLKLAKLCWPHVFFYKEQREIIYSVRDTPQTFVGAGNQLGKDFVSAFIVLWFFLSRRPARVVTTSVKQSQLEDVLWGEIKRFLNTTVKPLPVHRKHLHLRQVKNSAIGKPNPLPHEFIDLTELVGEVSKQGEGLLGRHAALLEDGTATTLACFDEASGCDDTNFDSVDTWAHRKLVIGNCFDCTNFFYRGIKAGTKKHPVNPDLLFRKVFKIKAEDSPNVKLAVKEIAEGKKPSGRILVPGAKDYNTYMVHRSEWDEKMQCIGLDAEFYEGDDVRLIPLQWLSEARTDKARGVASGPVYIGVDPAEGGDLSVWTVVDSVGILEQLSMKTPDTSAIPSQTLALMNKWKCKANNVFFDRGGGGKQIADQLRKSGFKVNTVGFGETVSLEKRRGVTTLDKRKETDEERYTYKNRRAQMYAMIRESINPLNGKPFAFPSGILDRVNGNDRKSLENQLLPIPLEYDEEGRLKLAPKQKKSKDDKTITLTEIIGHSPDEADSLALALYGLKRRRNVAVAG
jgi:hypothetical protein